MKKKNKRADFDEIVISIAMSTGIAKEIKYVKEELKKSGVTVKQLRMEIKDTTIMH